MSDKIEKHLSTISKSLYVIAEMLTKRVGYSIPDSHYSEMEDMLDEIRKQLDGPCAFDMNNRRKNE